MMHVLVCEDVYKNGEHFCDFHQHSEKWKLPPTEMNIIVCLYNLPSFGTKYIFIIHAYNHTNKKKQKLFMNSNLIYDYDYIINIIKRIYKKINLISNAFLYHTMQRFYNIISLFYNMSLFYNI